MNIEELSKLDSDLLAEALEIARKREKDIILENDMANVNKTLETINKTGYIKYELIDGKNKSLYYHNIKKCEPENLRNNSTHSIICECEESIVFIQEKRINKNKLVLYAEENSRLSIPSTLFSSIKSITSGEYDKMLLKYFPNIKYEL